MLKSPSSKVEYIPPSRLNLPNRYQSLSILDENSRIISPTKKRSNSLTNLLARFNQQSELHRPLDVHPKQANTRRPLSIMSFLSLRASVSILAVAILPLGQVSAWFMGVGHLPSCAFICLDRSVSLQSSCQDLKCICKQPNLLASSETCFRKECDLNSLSKALKLLATCQESFGVTPTRDPPVQSPSTPPTAPSPLPVTGYPGYPYTVPPPAANQLPSASYYPYPYPRVAAPVNTSNGAQLPPGATVPPAVSSSPGAGSQPQVSTPPTQVSPPPPQASTPTPQAPTPIGGVINGTTNSTAANPPTSASAYPLFPPRSNSSASPAAGDAAFASARSLFQNQNSGIFLLILFSSLLYV